MSDAAADDGTLPVQDEQGRVWRLPLSSSDTVEGDAVTFWRAAPSRLPGLSAADEVELVAHFGADPGVFLREQFTEQELRRLGFARWRLAGQELANRLVSLPPASSHESCQHRISPHCMTEGCP